MRPEVGALLALLLAGCVEGTPARSLPVGEAWQAVEANGEVPEGALLYGATGFEGIPDWNAIHAAVEPYRTGAAATDLWLPTTARLVLDGFEPLADGRAGDGRARLWMLVWLEAPPGETEQTIWEQRWEDAVMQSAVGSSKGYVRCKPLQGAWIDSDDAVRTAEAALGTPHEAALWLDLDLAGFAGGGFGDDWCQGSPEWIVRWFDAGKLLDGGTIVTEVRLDPASGEVRSVRTGRIVLPGDVAWSTHAERTLTPADQAMEERWDVVVPDGLAALRPLVERQGVAVPCPVVGVAEFTLHGPDGQAVPWELVEWPTPGTWSVRWPSGPAGCAGDTETRLALDVVR